MVNQETRSKYITTIGIECHVQLKTKTKLFASVGNDARSAEPNTLISHICLGMPGALPVLNKKAIYLAAKAAFALGTTPQKFSKFDRKHYFYPDLPKGYQITQFDQPIILGGFVDIVVENEKKRINLTRAHLEEDAGKSTHPAGQDYSLVDLNRAGTPLLEIVSEPEMHSPEEAKAYARELYILMKFADVSYANLFYGNMRFDVNVSVSKDDSLGIRSETKNLNSFRSVEKAVEYEINRQIELLEKGNKIIQETRGWDDAKQKTFSQRSKEEANDYRYFPDPDLPPVLIDEDFINKIQYEMPNMPAYWRKQLETLGLDKVQIEILIENEVESSSVNYLSLLKDLKNPELIKYISNWLVNLEIPLRQSNKDKLTKIDDIKRVEIYQFIYQLLKENKLSSTNAKKLIKDILLEKNTPSNIEKFASDKGYIQLTDESEIDRIVKEVILNNQTAADDFIKGEEKAIGFLIGQVMKMSQGKANPSTARELIIKNLNLSK